MVKKTTLGISVSVEVSYQESFSRPLYSEYLFAYRITIENNAAVPMKLLRRKWKIIESNGTRRTVEGEGVVGEQPIIMPGEHYRYESAAHINTDMGKMSGHYVMANLNNLKEHLIDIPEFHLISPSKLN